MEYSNPELPEGINTSKEHPLKEFLILTAGVTLIISGLILILVLLSDHFAKYIPFSWEKHISLSFVDEAPKNTTNKKNIETYLQNLADKLVLKQPLPDDMTIKVHYLDQDQVNAFATLGGHVYFYRGLLDKMTSENALAMVMAHEIAHVRYRHPIQSLGRGVIFAVIVSTVSSSVGDTIMQSLFNQAGFLTVLKFNRQMEIASDEYAIQSLYAHYGHLKGADDLFKILQDEHGDNEPYEFLNTHPLTTKRLKYIQTTEEKYRPATNAELTALPDQFKKWLANNQK